MPWSWYMAQWLHDPNASFLLGKPSFRRPYPQEDWLEDVAWNRFPLEAMAYTVEALRVLRKNVEAWTDAEKDWYQQMQKGVMDLEKHNYGQQSA